MEGNSFDILTLISNPEGLTFATTRNWRKLLTDDVSILEGYVVIGTMLTTGSVYITIRNMNPQTWRLNFNDIKLLKITTNEDTGKLDFFLMDLNANEAEQIRNNPYTLWD